MKGNLKKAFHAAKAPVKFAREFKQEFSTQTVTLITAAFGFVAALFWNEAIKEMIVALVPEAKIWQYKIVSAILVTVIAVAAIFVISRYLQAHKSS